MFRVFSTAGKLEVKMNTSSLRVCGRDVGISNTVFYFVTVYVSFCGFVSVFWQLNICKL